MMQWTLEDVANRFREAVETGRRLPPVRVQGYFSVWPPIVRTQWELFASEDREYRPLPPTPDAIDRMMEVIRWIQWLEMEQRHLVWMRAKNYEWDQVGRRFGCCRTTAWRRWKLALEIIVLQLNTCVADRPKRMGQGG